MAYIIYGAGVHVFQQKHGILYIFTDNLNCLQSVTLQKQTVAVLKSELNLAQQLQQGQAEKLAKIQLELHNGEPLYSY